MLSFLYYWFHYYQVIFMPNTFQSIFSKLIQAEILKNMKTTLFGLSIDYPSTWLIEEFEKNIKNDRYGWY